MATKKPKKRQRGSPRKRVSSFKATTKRSKARAKTQRPRAKAATRKHGRSATKRSAKPAKSAAPKRKPATRVARAGTKGTPKRAASQRNVRPIPKQDRAGAKRRERERKLERELSETRSQLRATRQALRDRLSTGGGSDAPPDAPQRPRDVIEDETSEGFPNGIPKGATILARDEDGNPSAFTMDVYMDGGWEDIDFGDFDYDDIYDEFGDEDEDSYAEAT